MISAFWNRSFTAAERGDAGLNARREIVDLHAGVVVIELARHLPAGRLEQRRDRVSERRLPAVTDVQRPGRVRGDKFDVDGLTVSNVRLSKIFIRADNIAHALGDELRIETEVHEPRTGDVDSLDARIGELHPIAQQSRDLSRLFSQASRERHREIGRPVSKRRIARPRDRGLDWVGGAKLARGSDELRANAIG